MPLNLKIVTPERTVIDESVEQVTLTTTSGQITILPHHVPLVTVLQPGELIAIRNSQLEQYAVSGGFAKIDGESVTVLADTTEHIDEIDEARAEEAKLRAEKALVERERQDDVDYTRLASQLEKELARLKVARRRRHQR
ncbi:MAG: ATP synthase F1 subunit epsilon [Candidatus Buchananbacteria bacterium]|nr:ATP synthase F1 subunit epsilon [Candidatus Buchananbacteria bacterium]